MSTAIWCDHVKHVVLEPRTKVEDLIASVKGADPDDPDYSPSGFAYFTPVQQGRGPTEDGAWPTQRALNVWLISSFEAVAGDPI